MRKALAGLALVAVAGAAGVAVLRGTGPLPDPEGCTATVDGRVVQLSTEQAENAALIAAIGVHRGLPARAVSIALATAYQESKIVNVSFGDRDSVGLFQQRPSQGWGTPDQLMNPVYATNAFYDALVKIEGYQAMRITEAAQKVQRSAFPEAYEDHALDGRAIASGLTGWSPGSFTCVVRHTGEEPEPDKLDAQGLTHRAAVVKKEIRHAFGDLPLGGFAPGGVSSGHQEGSAHYEGRAIDVFFRPVTKENNRAGWALASYLVAQADRLSIQTVIFDGKIWHAGTGSEQGWQDYDPGDTPGDRSVLEHRDHVHVDVTD